MQRTEPGPCTVSRGDVRWKRQQSVIPNPLLTCTLAPRRVVAEPTTVPSHRNTMPRVRNGTKLNEIRKRFCPEATARGKPSSACASIHACCVDSQHLGCILTFVQRKDVLPPEPSVVTLGFWVPLLRRASRMHPHRKVTAVHDLLGSSFRSLRVPRWSSSWEALASRATLDAPCHLPWPPPVCARLLWATSASDVVKAARSAASLERVSPRGRSCSEVSHRKALVARPISQPSRPTAAWSSVWLAISKQHDQQRRAAEL